MIWVVALAVALGFMFWCSDPSEEFERAIDSLLRDLDRIENRKEEVER